MWFQSINVRRFCQTVVLLATLLSRDSIAAEAHEFMGKGQNSGPYTLECGWTPLYSNIGDTEETLARQVYALGFIGKIGDESPGIKSAVMRWKAPEGQVITSASFDLREVNGTKFWRSTVSRGDSDDPLANNILWVRTADLGAQEGIKLEFKASDNIRAIDFGFQSAKIHLGWKSLYQNIVIKTEAVK